jgi:rhamnose utilization protein RhaD (predicted bifunctional aldolase and dehydrogenase)
MMNTMQPAELEALRVFSARIGSDPSLTQAAGGNTSFKSEGVLWIKASGTWLAHALERDIMVPVRIVPLLDAVARADGAAEQAQQFTIEELNPLGLLPSIETTVHALLGQTVVVHIHCVDTIARAVRTDSEAQLRQSLTGLDWAYVPYVRPGLPLALAIAKLGARPPDILVLGNHGLVIAAASVAEAEALLAEVKARVKIEPRPERQPELGPLRAQAAGYDYRLPSCEEAHTVALDPVSTTIAAGGTLYPDHVIFLGVGSVVARDGENIAEVTRRVGEPPAAILFPGKGVLMRRDTTPSADAMARCLADVVARVPEGSALRYLTREENLELTNWDAEKYRQQLNREAAAADQPAPGAEH